MTIAALFFFMVRPSDAFGQRISRHLLKLGLGVAVDFLAVGFGSKGCQVTSVACILFFNGVNRYAKKTEQLVRVCIESSEFPFGLSA